MNLPICSVCLNSDLLCPACQEKVDKKLVSEKELELYRRVSQLSEKFKGLKDVEIESLIEDKDVLVVVCSKGDVSRVVGRGGSNIKRLGRELGKTGRIVEKSADKRKFLQDLVFPVPIKTFGLVYTQEGEKYKVRLSSGRIPIPRKSFISIAEKFLGKNVELEFEKEEQETTEDKIKRLVRQMNS